MTSEERRNVTILAAVRLWSGIVAAAAAMGLVLSVAYLLIRKQEFRSEAILGLTPSSSGVGLEQRMASRLGVGGLLGLDEGALSPELMAVVLVSPSVLDSTLRDTVPASISPGISGTYGSFLAPDATSSVEMIDRARRKVTHNVGVDLSSAAQTLTLTVQERSPQLAQWVSGRLIAHLDQALRQARIADARGRFQYLSNELTNYDAALHAAETALFEFMMQNRSRESSPMLQLQQMRLQRAVDIAQASYTSLLTQREMVGAQTSESAPQVAVYSSPTLPYRPTQIAPVFLITAWLVMFISLGVAAALLLTTYEGHLGRVHRAALRLNNRIASFGRPAPR